MRFALTLLAMAGIGGGFAGEDKPCDVATVEESFWCFKCKKPLEKEQVDGGHCKECKTAAEAIRVCVKKWIPSCGMHGQQPHLEECCKSKFCCKVEVVKRPVLFACEGCGQTGRKEDSVAHDAKAHDKKVVRRCEGSGTRPHGGEPIE